MPGKQDPVRRQRPTSTGPRKSPEDVADPANGERVMRCRSCGLPDQPTNRVIPGMWGYIRFNVVYELCERCIQAAMPSRMALDPLTLDEVA